MAKAQYTFEIATNTPTGIWKVAERTFWNRQLTMAEKKRCWAANADVPILAAALTTLKVEGEEVTAEWIEEHLTERDLGVAFAYILGGPDAVTKYLANG
ncbi:hypothetical protein Q0M94_28245 (plasmid) [Deinococcus radiomollis]|uniref:hypothetical protein n=1 Tax=Deinococcus radiomollis TaxID=468916 RepID=UPI003891F762